jgi:hypothetical protein
MIEDDELANCEERDYNIGESGKEAVTSALMNDYFLVNRNVFNNNRSRSSTPQTKAPRSKVNLQTKI